MADLNISIQPVLTIAIPTRNRSYYLEKNLEQLKREIKQIEANLVEIIVSDNCSADNTGSIVDSAIKTGGAISYVRNAEDIGWGRNFLQCFELARGAYVLILGDDDFFVDGALKKLIEKLQNAEYGVVCLQTYGFDIDCKDEQPYNSSTDRLYTNPGKFIRDVGAYVTLISACVINKNLVKDFRSGWQKYPNLPVLYLVLRAAIRSERNLYIREYMVGCKRNNSANYIFSDIFVDEMWSIIDKECSNFISPKWIKEFERKLLIGYYPLYFLQLRLGKNEQVSLNLEACDRRFSLSMAYRYWLRPILTLPRYLAIAHGLIVTALGRVWDGDFLRGFYYLKAKLVRLFR